MSALCGSAWMAYESSSSSNSYSSSVVEAFENEDDDDLPMRKRLNRLLGLFCLTVLTGSGLASVLLSIGTELHSVPQDRGS